MKSFILYSLVCLCLVGCSQRWIDVPEKEAQYWIGNEYISKDILYIYHEKQENIYVLKNWINDRRKIDSIGSYESNTKFNIIGRRDFFLPGFGIIRYCILSTASPPKGTLAISISHLGYLFKNNKIIQMKSTFDNILESANEDDVVAQYEIANIYRYSKGVPSNIRKRCYWLEKSANNGFSKAQIETGIYYFNEILYDNFREKAKETRKYDFVELKSKAHKYLRLALTNGETEANLFLKALPLVDKNVRWYSDVFKDKAAGKIAIKHAGRYPAGKVGW